MQQRRLRLGDILDDYCPRERRVTNHAVVAIVEEEVRQTRCTTCDADHEYRHGKAPTLRKPKSGALAADVPGGRPVLASPKPDAPMSIDESTSEPDVQAPAGARLPTAVDVAPQHLTALPDHDRAPLREPEPGSDSVHLEGARDDQDRDARGHDDDGPVHRPLIRATFPRPEGHVPARREPEFTIRQPTGQRGRGHGPQGHGGQRAGGGRGFGGDGAWGRGPGHRGGQRAGGAPQHGGFGRGPRHGGGGPGRKSGR